MKIRYDSDADAMYLVLRDGKIDHTKEVNPNLMVDFDNAGNILGVEFLFVKEKNPQLLNEFQIPNLVPV